MHYAVLSKIDCTISKLRALFPELTGKRCIPSITTCFRLYTYAPRPGHGPETHRHRGARAPHGVLVHVPPSSFEVTLEGGDTGVGGSGDLAL